MADRGASLWVARAGWGAGGDVLTAEDDLTTCFSFPWQPAAAACRQMRNLEACPQDARGNGSRKISVSLWGSVLGFLVLLVVVLLLCLGLSLSIMWAGSLWLVGLCHSGHPCY